MPSLIEQTRQRRANARKWRKLYEGGMTAREIAERHGVSMGLVYRGLHEVGTELRPSGTPGWATMPM